jgi:hypothetical protein
MKTVFRASSLVAVALIAGLALAALCKLIYDLFHGYALVPNLLIDLGFLPSTGLLEVLQFFAIAAPSFLAGTALLRALPRTPGRVAFASAVPWVALCVWGILTGIFGEHGKVLL